MNEDHSDALLSASDHQQLAQNLMAVRNRIHAACQRVNRAVDSVCMVAVTKYSGPRLCQSLVAHGQLDLGENRIPHLNTVAQALEPNEAVRWHMIGHLQRNKVRGIQPSMALLHSLDSSKLAAELQKRLEHPLPVLIQVNISGESQKSGILADELSGFLDHLDRYDKLRPRGLMTMAMMGSGEAGRPIFRDLAALRDKEQSRGRDEFCELSMGMSNDFEVAIEEGASIVRIGRVLYERLQDIDNNPNTMKIS
jgi:PLP dependent protein